MCVCTYICILTYIGVCVYTQLYMYADLYRCVCIYSSVIRQRVSRACRMEDASSRDNAQVAQHLNHERIQVLVDLTGLTLGPRMHLLAAHPCPVQVHTATLLQHTATHCNILQHTTTELEFRGTETDVWGGYDE